MCGIAGQLAFDGPKVKAVETALRALHHRGPDGTGIYADQHIAMAHARLAIVDLEGGAQPIFNEDESVCIVFNGEIYNYSELRRELKHRHQFKTEGDTEVLVHLYEDLGASLFERIDGMFSLAIWDKRRKQLLCARDRFGEKPFYYSYDKGVFSFASELWALLSAGLVKAEIDERALSTFLELLYIPAPITILREVRKLQPGWMLTVDSRGLAERCYWRPPVPGEARPEEVLGDEQLLQLLRQAVESRMHADVDVAALLSGGIDSSVVTALMAQSSSRRIKTFTVGFGKDTRDLELARLVAQRFSTDHVELVVSEPSPDFVTEALAWYPEPFGDSSAIPTMAVCREVSRHVKVVLSGDGGDELFGGYGKYRTLDTMPRIDMPLLSLLGQPFSRGGLGRKISRRIAAATLPAGPANRALTEVFSAPERGRLLGKVIPPAPYGVSANSVADTAMAFDLGYYLPDDLLSKVDIASMRYSIEARCPFLSPTLAEAVVPLNRRTKFSRKEGKLQLRKLASRLLPSAITTAEKRGFGAPLVEWLSSPKLKDAVQDLLRPNSPVSRYLNPEELGAIVADSMRSGGNPHQVWALLSLNSWLIRLEFHKPGLVM